MSITDPYDASEQEDRSRSGYLDRKDIRIIGIALVAILLILWPIYRHMVGDANRHICQNNMSQIMKALGTYAADHDDHFPVVLADADVAGNPVVFEGMANTWMSQIQPYMSPKASFVCPSADSSEYALNHKVQDPRLGPEVKQDPSFNSTYAMYAPRSGAMESWVKEPGEAILIAESANMGARNTYDPLRLKANGGKEDSPVDGFIIGWDRSEMVPVGPTMAERPAYDAEYVTRLPFYDTKSGKFLSDGDSRHSSGINALTVSGTLKYIKPEQARLVRGANHEVVGIWAPN